MRDPRPIERRRREGFTIVEMMVAVGIAVAVLAGVLTLFDTANELARVQTAIADLQQSARAGKRELVRMTRMAGRGGLPSVLPQPLGGLGAPVRVDQGVAIGIRNNVGLAGVDDDVAIGFAGSPTAVTGSDIVTVRGVITNSIYQVPSAGESSTLVLRDGAGAVTPDPTVATNGSIVVTNPGPTGIAQDLSPLAEAITLGVPEAIILTSVVDDDIYAVVELANGSSVDDVDNPTVANVNFNVIGGAHTNDYRTLFDAGGGNLPAGLTTVAFVGIVEEYRFYVRARRSIPGNPSSELLPVLSRARLFPGSEVAYRGLLSELQVDIADNFLNLQAAMAFDSVLGEPLTDRNGDGLINEDDVALTETEDGGDDDWLFNGVDDNPTDPSQPWQSPWDDDPGTPPPPEPRLQFLRLTALVRSERAERTLEAPLLLNIEDLFYATPPMNVWNDADNRKYRRRTMESIVDMRNLG